MAAFSLSIATPSPAQQVTLSPDAMASAIIARHNAWRQQLNLAPLQWANDLAQSSQQWSNHLANNGCQMVHSSGNNVGENLFWMSPKITTWSDGRQEVTVQAVTPGRVVDLWGEEVQWYDYDKNACNAPAGEACGHYTQIVWAATTHVGCAMAVCPDSGQIWTCQYRPAGNVIGQRPY